jgi:hypothetical protein
MNQVKKWNIPTIHTLPTGVKRDMYTYIYIHVYLYTYIHISKYTYAYIHISMYTYIHKHVKILTRWKSEIFLLYIHYTLEWKGIFVNTYIYMYIYVYIFVYIYIYYMHLFIIINKLGEKMEYSYYTYSSYRSEKGYIYKYIYMYIYRYMYT